MFLLQPVATLSETKGLNPEPKRRGPSAYVACPRGPELEAHRPSGNRAGDQTPDIPASRAIEDENGEANEPHTDSMGVGLHDVQPFAEVARQTVVST